MSAQRVINVHDRLLHLPGDSRVCIRLTCLVVCSTHARMSVCENAHVTRVEVKYFCNGKLFKSSAVLLILRPDPLPSSNFMAS